MARPTVGVRGTDEAVMALAKVIVDLRARVEALEGRGDHQLAEGVPPVPCPDCGGQGYKARANGDWGPCFACNGGGKAEGGGR